MARVAEQARAAVSARKDHTGTKKLKEKADTESSSDSDVERAAEAEAKRSREKERKRRLSEVEADSERVDHMIAEAEAKNQAKMAKLAEVRASYPVISIQCAVFRI